MAIVSAAIVDSASSAHRSSRGPGPGSRQRPARPADAVADAVNTVTMSSTATLRLWGCSYWLFFVETIVKSGLLGSCGMVGGAIPTNTMLILVAK